MKIEQLGRRGGIRIPMTTTVRDAAKQMLSERASALIVTEDGPPRGRIVGILTDHDIVTKGVVLYDALDDVLVADIMQPKILCIDTSAEIDEALQLMSGNGVRRLAMIGEDQTLVGILSIEDVIAAMAGDWALLSTLAYLERPRESPIPEATRPSAAA